MTYKNSRVIVTPRSKYQTPVGPVTIFPKKYNINPVSLAGYISNDAKDFYVELFGMTYGHLFISCEFMNKEFDEPMGFIKFRTRADNLINKGDLSVSIDHSERNFFIPIIQEKCEELQFIISMVGIPFDGKRVPIYNDGEIKLMKPIDEICKDSKFDYVGNAVKILNMNQTER